jgi:hypothetical protein
LAAAVEMEMVVAAAVELEVEGLECSGSAV